MEKVGFLEKAPGEKSHKRLLALIFAIYSIIMTTAVYILSKDYVAAIAVWGAITGTVLVLVGVGKALENGEKK